MDNKKEELFFEQLGEFVMNATSNIFMAGYIKMERDIYLFPRMKQLLADYLNMCWHGYNRGTDSFVVEKFNLLLSHNIIKGMNCLMNWIARICTRIIYIFERKAVFDKTKPDEPDKTRIFFRQNIKKCYDHTIKKYKDIKCCANECNLQPYDGKDFFFTSVSAICSTKESK